MSQPSYDSSTQFPTAPLPPAPTRKAFHKRPAVWAVAAALVIGVGIGNASGGTEETSAAAPASISAEPTPSEVAPRTPAPVTVTVTPPPTSTSSAPAEATTPVVDFAMPDLVGLDLQSAQDTVQDNGVLVSLSHDLRGMRQQVLDSNWVVCTQNIPAGQRVTGDVEGTIDLGVVKREESCP